MPSTEACEKEPVLACTSNMATHHPDIKGKRRGAHAGDFSLKLSVVFHLAQTSYSLCAPGSLITWVQSVLAFIAFCLLLAQGLQAARLSRKELSFIKDFKVSSVSFSFCFGTKPIPHGLKAQTGLKIAFSLLIQCVMIFFTLATTWREKSRNITHEISEVTSLLWHWAGISYIFLQYSLPGNTVSPSCFFTTYSQEGNFCGISLNSFHCCTFCNEHSEGGAANALEIL